LTQLFSSGAFLCGFAAGLQTAPVALGPSGIAHGSAVQHTAVAEIVAFLGRKQLF